MSKIKLLGIAVVALLLVNLATLAFVVFNKGGQRPLPPGPGRIEEGPKKIIIERLHFDEEQVDQYEKLIDGHKKTIRELDAQIKDTKNSLYATLSSASQQNKDSLQARLGEIQKQIESVHYNHFADIKKLCKPDQLKEFDELTKDLARFFAAGKNHPPPPKD